MPCLATMTHHCKPRELTVAMAAVYDLEAEHVSLVTGNGEDTNKVQSIVEDAQELREAAAVESSEGAFEGATAGEADEAGDGTDGGTGQGGRDDANGDGPGGDTDGAGAAAGTAGDDASAQGRAPTEAAEDSDQQSGLGDFV
jgi:replication factor C large subunit